MPKRRHFDLRGADDACLYIPVVYLSTGVAPFYMILLSRPLTADLSAVRAAFDSPWSSGQVEGQINRLKFLKRQMYGRANLDLLRARVLHPN